LRTIGVITSCQRINDAAWNRPDLANIRRGVVGDGLSCLAAGLLGAPGMSVAPSLVGVSSATGATSRVIAYATAAFLLALAFLPKFAAAIIGLPLEIAGGLLVFTASFMISSGIQIMAARTLDIRASFAISIALFLGLSTQVSPAYFHALPGMVKTVASDMLSVSLTAAIALTLVFRLGARRKQVMAWRNADASLSDFGTFLDKQGETWKLSTDLLERARQSVTAVVQHLKEAHLIEAPLAISTSYDGIYLGVELTYRGRLLMVAHSTKDEEKDNEEAAMAAGLKSFIMGLHADRTEIAAKGADVTIRLDFAA
jgi:NCS2 family nucleobase:cation symporter-2